MYFSGLGDLDIQIRSLRQNTKDPAGIWHDPLLFVKKKGFYSKMHSISDDIK